jgi:tetratricopeptide (TPR) repeat protein
MLALDRAAEVNLSPADREQLTHRALGILPSHEAQRFQEVSSCPALSPHHMTSNPDRYVKGVAEIEREMGQATVLGYGFLLMAGVRTNEDLRKYGQRLQDLFDGVTDAPAIVGELEAMREDGIESLSHLRRLKVLRALREQLWLRNTSRPGRAFLLTQVIDGYLNLRKGGVGDDLGLAVVDSLMAAKLAFPVNYLTREGRIYSEIAVSSRGREYWDPLARTGEVAHRHMRPMSMLDLFAQGYLRMARGYANTSAHAHGIRIAQWVIGMKPDSAEAHQILGQCLLGKQQPKEAIRACEKALSLDRRLADAYYVQGNAYSAMSRWPEAVECYRQAIRNRIGFAEAYNNLGLALARSGEFDRAAGAYSEATRVRPGYVEAYYNLGNLYFERAQAAQAGPSSADYDPAIEAYRKAVKQAPDFAAAFYNLGQAYYAKRDLDGALEAYQAAVKANPKHAGAWHNLGIVYRDLGRQDLAVEAIEEAVQLNPMLLR